MADRVVTVGPSGYNYTTPALAIAGQSDFQADEDNIEFRIYSGSYGRFAVASGFTTSSSHRIIFKAMSSHNLVRDTGVRIVNANEWYAAVSLSLSYIELDGLAIKNAMTNDATGVGMVNGADNCVIKNCITYDCNNHGYYSAYGSTGNKFINCVSVNCLNGFYIGGSSCTNYYYYCTTLNATNYGFFNSAWSTMYIKNCYSGGSGNSDYYNTANGTINFTTSRSEDGTCSTSTISLANCAFGSYTDGSEDVKIGSASSLRSIGTDLSADSVYPISVDCFGNTRASTPCIGASEYVSSVNYIPAIINNYRQQGVM